MARGGGAVMGKLLCWVGLHAWVRMIRAGRQEFHHTWGSFWWPLNGVGFRRCDRCRAERGGMLSWSADSVYWDKKGWTHTDAL